MVAATGSRKPFAGVRILDFTRVLAGPFCTAIFADLGADVVKIEPPGGDDQRGLGAFKNGASVNFELVNRGKRSLRLDLKKPEGVELARALAARCDVVVENFRPGVADKLGIGYDALRADRNDLIYCSISGFGQSGPLAQHPSYDVVAQAASGLMDLTGFADQGPVLVGDSVGDTVSGLYAAFGIAAALFRRAQTGAGARLDIAMLDSLFSLLPTALAQWQATGVAPTRSGQRHPLSAPFGAYRASDKPFIVAIVNNALFTRFAQLIGRPDLLADVRFASDQLRGRNEEALRSAIEGWAREHRAADVVRLLLDAGIPSSEIWNVTETAAGPHAACRQLLTPVAHESVGDLRLPEQPVHFDDVPRGAIRIAPKLGGNSASILSELLELSSEQVARLSNADVI